MKPAFTPKEGARRRVGARAARHDDRRAHVAVKLLGTGLVDELHGALVDLLLDEEGLVRMGEHVNDGVAEGENVDAGLGHEPPRLGKDGALSHPW